MPTCKCGLHSRARARALGRTRVRHNATLGAHKSMEPLATYDEVRFDGRRRFALFPDHVHYRIKLTLGTDCEGSIPLQLLDPNYDRMHHRNPIIIGGMIFAVIGFATASVLNAAFSVSLLNPGLVLMLVIGGTGLALCAATWRKVEFIRFRGPSGTSILDIARAGPNAERFDSFVAALVRQITECRAKGHQSDSTEV